jgi:hypothetical protein
MVRRCIERDSQHVPQFPERFDERREQSCEIIVYCKGVTGRVPDVTSIQYVQYSVQYSVLSVREFAKWPEKALELKICWLQWHNI